MEEADVFGFQDPETGKLGFVSVMGKLGQYKAVAVYRGVEGLYSWRNFRELLELNPESEDGHDMVLEIPQLQLAFGPNEFLEKHDREAIKLSGIKFPKDTKPIFRSYRPGYLPWFVTQEEARHLLHGLAQTINVSTKFLADHNLIPVNEGPEDRDYLILTPRSEGSKIEWDYSMTTIDPPPTQLVPFSIEASLVARLKELTRSGAHEVELFSLPARVGARNERPRSLYALLVSDSASYFVLGVEVLEATAGIDLMYAGLAENVASRWAEYEMVPEEIRVRSIRLASALEPLEEFGVSISLVEELPAIDHVKSMLIQQVQLGS
jgi:hypothetical protein